MEQLRSSSLKIKEMQMNFQNSNQVDRNTNNDLPYVIERGSSKMERMPSAIEAQNDEFDQMINKRQNALKKNLSRIYLPTFDRPSITPEQKSNLPDHNLPKFGGDSQINSKPMV